MVKYCNYAFPSGRNIAKFNQLKWGKCLKGISLFAPNLCSELAKDDDYFLTIPFTFTSPYDDRFS